MRTQKDYWEKFICNWDKSAYTSDKSKLSGIEKLATYFRSPIRFRHQFTVDLLSSRVYGLKILELGCGIGRLSSSLIESGASHITGVDISSLAVDKCADRFRQENIDQGKWEFISADLACFDFNSVDYDLVVGLGILQYLTNQQVVEVFENCRGKFIFFEFHEKIFNIINIMHYIYRGMKSMSADQMPLYIIRNRSSMKNIVKKALGEEVRYLHENGQSFLTNLSGLGSDWSAL